MSLPLPDYNKKINKGDISFVYKGVYHPIQWFGDDPYRPRVETIVIKNCNQIFLRMYEEKGDYDYNYRLPGGSLDNDSTKIAQAENEVNEEALLRLKNIYQSPVSYFENYPDGFLLKNGDICIAYKGTYTDVFVAEYSGKQDKSKIDEHDLDDDMANNGKFYYITNVADSLRPEHIDAILNCPFVSDNTKGAIRLLFNNKIPSSVVNESVVVEGKVANPRKHHYNSYMSVELLDNEEPYGVDILSNSINENIWLATDVHIGDPKDTWENKRRRILKAINSKVKPDDHLLFLGDMVGHDTNVNTTMLKGFIKSINCDNIYLILGNNDYFSMDDYRDIGFKAVTDKFNYKNYIFTHCALPDVPEGYLNIHGHIHGSKMYYDMEPDRHVDVWDDNYVPIRLKDVVEKYESGEYVGMRKDFNLMNPTTESINSSIVPIFTVNTRYNSAFGVTTRTLTRSTFNHSSLALYSNLSEMYSYVRNLSGISEKNRKTGFDVETLDYYTYRDDDATMSVNAVFIGKDDFINLKNRIHKYLSSSNKTSYDYKNLFRVAFGVSIDDTDVNDNKMICSEFVAKMLTIANVDLPKSANLMLPDDIDDLCKTNSNVINVFTGRIKDYDKKKVDNVVKQVISTLTESVVTESVAGEIDNITSPDELSKWMRKNITYNHCNHFRSFEEVLSDKKGDCHDQVEFESKIFSDMGIKYGKLFVAEYKELPKCGATHSLLYYYKNDKIYWFENAWGGNEGIHGPYKSVKELKEDVSNKWKFSNGCDKLIWSTVKNVEPGMSLDDYVVSCLGSKIEKYLTESVVTEISAFESNNKVMANINIHTLHKRPIDENTLRPYLKEFNSLNYIDLSQDAKGFIFFDSEENPVAYVNVVNDLEGVYSIQQLQVLPRYKNSGLTSQLIDVAVRELRANKVIVSKRNEELHEEYLHGGFKDINETQFSYTMGRGEILHESVLTESNNNTNMRNFEFIDFKDSRAVKYLQSESYWKKYGEFHTKKSNGEIVIDKDKDCLAGYVFVNNKNSGTEGFITPLFVVSSYRNNGLGNKLLDDAIRKYGAIDLVVLKSNKVAINMYKKHGFVPIGKGNEKDSIWMKLKSKLTKDDKIININTI